MQRPAVAFAPRIYYFHPLIAGPLNAWPHHLRPSRRCATANFPRAVLLGWTH